MENAGSVRPAKNRWDETAETTKGDWFFFFLQKYIFLAALIVYTFISVLYESTFGAWN